MMCFTGELEDIIFQSNKEWLVTQESLRSLVVAPPWMPEQMIENAEMDSRLIAMGVLNLQNDQGHMSSFNR